ncbi:MAG: hydroxymethylglutaryl-CoA lyase [Salibacteraceae bacterium]
MPIRITECPRDAMQGVEPWIPTRNKVNYLNTLLTVGFDVLDFGSFVSPKAIPQLKDTEEVLDGLELDNTETSLLSIIANKRGADTASKFPQIQLLGYPFSISETFQKRNTNATIEESQKRVEEIATIATQANQEVLIYISMAFGNPYGDHWDPDLAAKWIERLSNNFGIKKFAMADTIGISDENRIQDLFSLVQREFKGLEIGAHLHSKPNESDGKIKAALKAGCTSFDVAINGLGGCPMAEDDLVGNISTQQLLESVPKEDLPTLNVEHFQNAVSMANSVFP